MPGSNEDLLFALALTKAADAPAAKVTIKLDMPDGEDDAVGQTLGRYKLLERIGEGGCGVVYVAEQTQPVRRRVALKVIKLGMDTTAVNGPFSASVGRRGKESPFPRRWRLAHFLNGGKNERNERREVHVPARPAGF
jgi:hypothetical protein